MRQHILIISIVLSFISCTQTNADNNEESKENLTDQVFPVKTEVIEKKAYREDQSFFGKVSATSEADLLTHTGGYVDYVKVSSGDRVKKGAKLCSIDGERYETQFNMAKLSEKVAKDNWTRLKNHLSKGRSSRLNVDKAHLDFLQSKKTRIEVETAYKEAYCIAPFDGVVTAVNIAKYKNVSPNQQTISLADLSEIKIEFFIPEKTMGDIKKGSYAEALVRKGEKEVAVPATIHAVDQKIDYKQKNYRSEVHLKNSDESFRPGMTVKVKVRNYDLQDQIVVPSESVLTLESSRVVMLVKDGVAKKVTVNVRSTNGKESLILDGLNVGDVLITNGQNQVVHGVKVKVVNDETKPGSKS